MASAGRLYMASGRLWSFCEEGERAAHAASLSSLQLHSLVVPKSWSASWRPWQVGSLCLLQALAPSLMSDWLLLLLVLGSSLILLQITFQCCALLQPC